MCALCAKDIYIFLLKNCCRIPRNLHYYALQRWSMVDVKFGQSDFGVATDPGSFLFRACSIAVTLQRRPQRPERQRRLDYAYHLFFLIEDYRLYTPTSLANREIHKPKRKWLPLVHHIP